MATYTAETVWSRGDTARAEFLAGRYSRRHQLRFDGGTEVPGSASPHNVRGPYADAAAVDPEEAFVSSLSSCHMLFALWFAQRRGWCIDRYADAASGTLEANSEGKQAMTFVVLRPKIDFSGEKRPSPADIEQLHHDAHEACFIANSVKTEVRVDPVPGDA